MRMANAVSHGLQAVTLTHVRYRSGDLLGHFLAWVSLFPALSLGGFISHFLFRRELQAMFFALGLVFSEIINHVIKSLVQQSRPLHYCAALECCNSPGWPSSHCQLVFFFAAYFTILTFRSGVGLATRLQKLVVALLSWTLAFLTMYSRVYLGYHTVSQVFAGAAIGLVLGGIWYWIVNSHLYRCFPAIEESAIGRYLYIKDSSHIANALKFEYDNARASRRQLSEEKLAKD